MDPEQYEGLPQSRSPSLRLLWAAAGCLLVAACGAGYLATTSLSGGQVAGCGQQSACNEVLSSRWAYWFGWPVSVPALGLYLILLAAAFTAWRAASPGVQNRARTLILTLGPLAVAAALWFVLVQAVVLKNWCRVCLATHMSASTGVCLLFIAFVRTWFPSNPNFAKALRRQVRFSAISTVLGLAVLIVGQAAVKKRFYLVSPIAGTSGFRGGHLILHHGQFKLDPAELPLLGSSAATNFVVSVFDYTCTHCRALHPLLLAAEAKYSGHLAIVSLPAPLDAGCNPVILITAQANENSCEYARLGLAVWRAQPGAFREFDDWMFSSNAPPALLEAHEKAEALVGKKALEHALADRWINRQIEIDVALYQANGRIIADARLPQLVIGDVVTHGTMQSLDELTQLIEQHTPLGQPHSPAGQ